MCEVLDINLRDKNFHRAFWLFAFLFFIQGVLISLLIGYQLFSLSSIFIFSLMILWIFLLAGFFIYRITKQISNLEKMLEKTSQQIYENVELPADERLKKPFINLQKIIVRLKKYEAKLSEQKEGFNTIIESVQDAIWIQNDKGVITSYNQSFADLIDSTEIKGKYFWHVVKIKALYDLIDETYQNPSSKTTEINFQNKFYIASASHSKFPEQTVFILSEITELKKVEIIKKDFVLNVSHELRTPLTSIKGYLEILEDETDEKFSDYLIVIKRNVDRLINIVSDLLSLSRLEHYRELEWELIDPEDLLQNISQIFYHKIEEKKLQFEYKIASGTGKFRADRFKLEQALINIIDNAIKYTNRGFIQIKIYSQKDNIVFQISDSGSGIAEKHLPRLFERFYVVDKSRSRKLGGTGLGLSIVKHIVNLHNGKIKVESETGIGTRFMIYLPSRIDE